MPLKTEMISDNSKNKDSFYLRCYKRDDHQCWYIYRRSHLLGLLRNAPRNDFGISAAGLQKWGSNSSHCLAIFKISSKLNFETKIFGILQKPALSRNKCPFLKNLLAQVFWDLINDIIFFIFILYSVTMKCTNSWEISTGGIWAKHDPMWPFQNIWKKNSRWREWVLKFGRDCLANITVLPLCRELSCRYYCAIFRSFSSRPLYSDPPAWISDLPPLGYITRPLHCTIC